MKMESIKDIILFLMGAFITFLLVLLILYGIDRLIDPLSMEITIAGTVFLITILTIILLILFIGIWKASKSYDEGKEETLIKNV